MKNKLTPSFINTSSVVLASIGVVLCLLPVFTQNKFLLSTAVYTFLFGAFGAAWNIIGGYGAQISWCHSSFAACGAYTSFLSYHYLGLSPFITMPFGMLIAFILATIIGRGTFRLRGTFFSLATIAFAEILKSMLLYFKDFTGGSTGKWITYNKSSFLKLSFSNDVPFYYITFILMLLIIGITAFFKRTKTGHFLSAIKGDEDAATTLGIETFKVKLRSFQLSAVLAAVVGTIYAYFLSYIDPYSICSMDLSVKIGMTAIVGGLGTIWGPILGSFILMPLTQFTNIFFAKVSGLSMLMYAIILVLVVLFKPEGMIAIFSKAKGDNQNFLTKLNVSLKKIPKNQGKAGEKHERVGRS
jgi:branched-chain amino acid transport system permease protein